MYIYGKENGHGKEKGHLKKETKSLLTEPQNNIRRKTISKTRFKKYFSPYNEII